jgi:hypothetical protein
MPRRIRFTLLAALTLALMSTVLTPQAHAAMPRPLMGAATTDTASFTALNSTVGGLAARRTYNGSLPSSFAKSLAGADVAAKRVSYWSFKPNVKTFPSDTNAQAAFSAFLKTIPTGHKTVVFAHHEPEDNIRAGEYTLPQWAATNNKIGQIIDSLRRPELRLGVCFMGPWTFDARSTYYSLKWESYLNLSLVDVVGVDPYKFRTSDASLQAQMTVGNSGTGNTSAPSVMQKMATWKKPVVIAEWGAVTRDRKTGAVISDSERAKWISEGYNWIKAWNGNSANSSKIEAALYFHLVYGGMTFTLSGGSLTAFKNAVADSRR